MTTENASRDMTWLDDIDMHSVDMRQFIHFRQSTLPDGMRIIDAYNSSGLTFTLLPDRGLDIWTAAYNGLPLTWISQGSPHAASNENSDWLRQFNGGLLTTCGLTHVGAAETDPQSGNQRGLHGRYTFQQAYDISTTLTQDTSGENRWQAQATAYIAQSALFGEQLQNRRRYTLYLGDPAIHIEDTITNRGDTAVPLMVLYHCNLGYPFVRDGTKLLIASDVYPRDDAARAGYDHWQSYERATAHYDEQVFFHHLYMGEDGQASPVVIYNGNIGLQFTFSESLPYLTQWKNTRRGIYVNGIEPGNCIPEGQNAAREANRLQMLNPGETCRFRLTLHIIDTQSQVTALKETIRGIQQQGYLNDRCDLSDYE